MELVVSDLLRRCIGLGNRSLDLVPMASAVAVILSFASTPLIAAQNVTSSGTGFFVHCDGWLVTNAHVVEGCTSVRVPGLGETGEWKVDKKTISRLLASLNPRLSRLSRFANPHRGLAKT